MSLTAPTERHPVTHDEVVGKQIHDEVMRSAQPVIHDEVVGMTKSWESDL